MGQITTVEHTLNLTNVTFVTGVPPPSASHVASKETFITASHIDVSLLLFLPPSPSL